MARTVTSRVYPTHSATRAAPREHVCAELVGRESSARIVKTRGLGRSARLVMRY